MGAVFQLKTMECHEFLQLRIDRRVVDPRRGRLIVAQGIAIRRIARLCRNGCTHAFCRVLTGRRATGNQGQRDDRGEVERVPSHN